MSDVSWSGLDVFDASQSPQPYSGGLNIDMPDPNQDIQQLSSAVGRGSVSFNGLDAPPPINIDVDEYLRTPGIQDVINSAENPTDMRQRVENALTIANMLDTPPAQAMEQLGVFSESLFGTQDQRTVAEQLRRAVRLGVEQTRYSMLGMRALLNNDEELEQELRSFEFTDPGDDNTFLRKAVIGVGTQIPRYTAALATGAGAAGAAGLAAAPFGAAKPAALWTFPKAVMTANMMMETGFMYGQLLSMEGEQGERVSRGAARVGSLAYGAAAGFLETMGQRLIAMPGGTRFVQALSQNLGSNFSAFVARTAARFGTAAIGEGATEFTQELASGFTQNIVAAVENAKANRIYNSQDFVFDQIARGELDQDTATNMLNNPRMLSSYIEEQGGREALGIGQRPGDGVFLLKDQQEIFSEASSAFVTAMITGGVFGTVPAIAGAGRDGRLHQAMRREIDAIIQEKIEANP